MLSWCVGLLISTLIALTYSAHNSFSVLVSLPLEIPAGMFYPGGNDWFFRVLMTLFGSCFYGFIVFLVLVFVRDALRRDRPEQ